TGQCHLNYVVPVVSGDYALIADSQGVTALPQTAHVQVSGLFQLGPGVGFDSTGELPEHPSNHFGTALVAGTIAPSLAAGYVQSAHGTLGINDMSLPLGGVF